MKHAREWTDVVLWSATVITSFAIAAVPTTAPAPDADRRLESPRPRPTSIWTPPSMTFPSITVLAIGDSITVGMDGIAYRDELSRLMHMTGQPHTWVVEAQGGTKCSWWAGHIESLIDQHDPDLIFLNCGTNDEPGDPTEASYRAILAMAKAKNVQVVASLIGTPDMRSDINEVRQYIDDWMLSTNDAIMRALVAHPTVPFASMWRVPADLEWLQADGIHPNKRGEAAWGQLFYQAARALRGWKTLEQMGTREMCGLSGTYRNSDPRPIPGVDYTVCLN